MTGDTALMAILTGKVYNTTTGRSGINRDDTPLAFSNGFLLPCAYVRQRGQIPQNFISDPIPRVLSVAQVVEIYLYEDTGYASIDSATLRLFSLFFGYTFTGSFPADWVNTTPRMRDEGILKGASMVRMDWQVISILQGGS
jgi:hypothetical protein